MRESGIPIYCHTCATTARGYREILDNSDGNQGTPGELFCEICNCAFVETVGQRVEQFLGLDPPANFSNPISNIIRPGNQNPFGGPIFPFPGSMRGPQFPLPNAMPHGIPDGIHQVIIDNILNSVLSGFRTPSDNEADFQSILHHILMNESSYASSQAASEETINSFQRTIVDDNSQRLDLGECNISFEEFNIGDTVVTLPCEHKFKEEAIVRWLKTSATCPVCRKSFSSSPIP